MALPLGAACAAPSYILNGYSLSGLHGVAPDEVLARLPQKAGARVTEADIAADQAIVAALLQAHHVPGRLLTSMAERHGRIWIIFDLVSPPEMVPDLFERQSFVGNVQLSAKALDDAVGLKPGEALSAARMNRARAAILQAYQLARPGRPVGVKAIVRRRANGQVVIEWAISE